MLISELIEELEKVKKEHGDLEVKVFDDEGFMGYCSEVWVETTAVHIEEEPFFKKITEVELLG